MKYRWICNFVI